MCDQLDNGNLDIAIRCRRASTGRQPLSNEPIVFDSARFRVPFAKVVIAAVALWRRYLGVDVASLAIVRTSLEL